MKLLVKLALALSTLLGISVAVEAVPVEARVINCSTKMYYRYATANCTGTDGNPPYTTRYALMLECSDGRTYTSGYKTAGTGSVRVNCPQFEWTVTRWLLYA